MLGSPHYNINNKIVILFHSHHHMHNNRPGYQQNARSAVTINTKPMFVGNTSYQNLQVQNYMSPASRPPRSPEGGIMKQSIGPYLTGHKNLKSHIRFHY